MPVIDAAEALVGADYAPSGPCRIDYDAAGIRSITPLPAAPARRLLVLPAPVNAHDHARPLSTTSFGAAGKPLETWLLRLAVMPSVDPYLAVAAPLARSALGGCAGAMVHLTRPMGGMPLPEEARHIARAASDVGIRIALAISMRDRNPLVYGDHGAVLDATGAADPGARALVEGTFLKPAPDAAAQVALVEAVADAVHGPMVDVQFGPAAVHWCSGPLLEAIARRSAETGRRVHMHLLETRYQRDWADRTYPQGMVRYLAEIGLLSPRLTVAHAVWARPDELELLSACGVRVAVNTSSNLHLKSGIAPVPAMLAAGVGVAMGLDGCAFDEDDDALRELRLFKALHAGWGFDEVLDPARALQAACVTGREAIGAPPGGMLAEGTPADLLVLDLDTLDRDGLVPPDPRHLLFARATRAHIAALIVAGRETVRDGVLAGADAARMEAQLREAYRAATAAMRAAWPAIEPALAAHYRNCLGCC
jgi:cytosine/adenosine deaminase-related metal-dependent hydrolase